MVEPGARLQTDEASGAAAGRATNLRYLAWILIAATPAIFALVTWDPSSGRDPLQGLMRFLGVPVLAVELAVIGIAFKEGYQPLRFIRPAPKWMRGALAALVVIAYFTAFLVALSPRYALIRTTMWMIHLLFGMGAAYLLATSSAALRKSLWRWVAIGLCAYLLILVAFLLSISAPETFEWVYFGLGVIHVRQLGFYSLVGAAAALGLAASARGRDYWLSVGAAALLLALSFWSGTRGSAVALFAALVLGALFLPALRTVRLLAAVAVSTVAAALISFIYLPPNSSFGLIRMSSASTAASLDEAGSGRVTMWLGTWRSVLERPLFGYGDSHFNRVVPEALGIYNHPHNVVLQILFQWGLVGALCFFALAAALAWRAYRLARTGSADTAPALLVAAGLAIMALYEGSFYHPYPIMMLALGLAYAVTSARPAAEAAGRSAS